MSKIELTQGGVKMIKWLRSPIRIVMHKHGLCWKFRFTISKFYSGKMIIIGFHRFALVIDSTMALVKLKTKYQLIQKKGAY